VDTTLARELFNVKEIADGLWLNAEAWLMLRLTV